MASRGKGCATLLLGGLLLLVWPLASCSTDDTTRPAPTVTSSGPALPTPSGAATDMATTLPSLSTSAVDVVDTLVVKGRAPMTGYAREAFGSDWEDTNDNGCDTRNDILRRDLTDIRVEDCVVLSGMLRDPYSSDVIEFTRGPVTSMDVQIDHVVALANAWATGAATWTPEKREQFANDRRNLLAVRGDLNMQKGDGDTATWLPPRKAYRCAYVTRQAEVKARYGLWVTPAEKAAMLRILGAC